MTIINPKSISGITSITTASGADNLLTVHTNNTTERIRINNDGDVIVGSGITVSPDGDIFATGVTTSTTFVGALTGNVTGNVSGSSGSATGNAGGLTGTPNISVGTIAGSTGTFTGDVDIADKIVHTGDTNTAIRFPAADTITAETGGSERLRINSSGYVGIGTNNPQRPFVISNSGAAGVEFNIPDGNGGLSLNLYNRVTTGYDPLTFNASYFVFGPGATEKARFDTSGNLLLGATSHQNGGFGGSSHGINIAGTQPQILLHETDTDKDGYFGLAGSILRIQTADSIPVTIWTNDTKRINVHETTGDTTIETGNLVIGTSGKGIDFSATGQGTGTMSNELLDDYEEGTFDPILQNGNNGYRFQYGYYVKVGAAVHFTAFIETSATPPSSNIAIGGLPFTSLNVNNANAYVFPMLTNRTAFGTSGNQLNARFYMATNSNYATLYYPVSSSSSNFSTVNADNMNAANASNVWMSGTYFTAS